MNSKQEGLEKKLLEMYPQIRKHGLAMSLTFNKEKDAWIINLKKGKHELNTHLDRKDADECMEGIKCVYLGVKIGEFVSNYLEDEKKITG